MKVKVGLPPNFDLIRMAVHPPHDALFCHGDTIFTLYEGEIPEDIIHHEEVHQKQQGKDIDGWWMKWIQHTDFRYEQELEAYAIQFNFIKTKFGAKAQKEALTELATQLATLYDLDMNVRELESKIRNKAKAI